MTIGNWNFSRRHLSDYLSHTLGCHRTAPPRASAPTMERKCTYIMHTKMYLYNAHLCQQNNQNRQEIPSGKQTWILNITICCRRIITQMTKWLIFNTQETAYQMVTTCLFLPQRMRVLLPLVSAFQPAPQLFHPTPTSFHPFRLCRRT